MRTLVGEDQYEFRTVPNAMLSVFRCYTDGCSAYDGTPLQERLFAEYGGIFFIGYCISFMFVTVGVFNLIMAIFIENVVSQAQHRRLQELGEATLEAKDLIKKVVAEVIFDDPDNTKIRADLE